ncbi:MAG: efflux RND transporter permease subunit [Elusimicrobiota bacterium]
MKLGSLFVKRPVMTTMVFMGIGLFGLIAWKQLPQELFPNISVPQLVVITKYQNAAPEEIENLLTKPIEEAVGTVPHLKRVRSVSKEGMSAVTLEFGWGVDMSFAHLSTREKLDRIKDRLPQEAEEAIIKRVNPFSHPILVISVTGDLSLPDMTDLAKDVIKKKLDKTDGVGSVTISGGQKREIIVEVDRGRLSASRVSLPMVEQALKNANYDYPAGTTQGKVVEYLVRTQGRFKTLDDIGKTIVQVENPEFDPTYKWKKTEDKGSYSKTTQEQRLISLSDLAQIKMSLEDKTSYSRYNGHENISISIQKHADANTVEVSRSVQEALKELRPSLPRSMKVDIVYNESNYILDSLNSMRDNVVIGGLLAFFVLFYFLGNVRDSFNVGLSIPVAIMATLIMMFITGGSVNMLTLAGIALSVGSISDCAIVVAENIARHHKKLGKNLLEASGDGTDEVSLSMVTSTATNVVVFLPLLFITGIAQQLFNDLIVVTIFTNIAGLFVSLTLIPRLSAYETKLPRFLEQGKLEKYTLTGENGKRLDNFYKRVLLFSLNDVKTVGLIMVLLFGLALLLLSWAPKVFMPKMDQGQFIIELEMPIGTRLEVSNLVTAKLEGILSNIKGVSAMANVGSAQEDEEIEALGSHQSRIVVNVDSKAGVPTDQVIHKFQELAKRENLEGGILTYILQDSPIRSALAGGAPVEVEVKGPELDQLKILSDRMVKEFDKEDNLFGVKTTFALPSKETKVIVDKDRASGFQLSVSDIARTALIAIKGIVATELKDEGKETNIRVRLREEDRENSDSIRQMTARSPQGLMVPLDAVAKVSSGVGASEIRHLDGQRSFVVTAEVSGSSTAKALKRVSQMLKNYRVSKEYTVELGGESRQIAESFSGLKYTFLLAIILIYMIMAAQFESLIQPLIILSTVPFSIIGIAFTLFVTNTPFSAVVALGSVILAGIVVNNGIVLIDLINAMRKEGMALREAIVFGCINRIRPILMTAITAVMGSFPLAIGLGKGDELASPLAQVTFGGMFVSTALTLIIIPILYEKATLFQEKRAAVKV